jgi:hypothetical protein
MRHRLLMLLDQRPATARITIRAPGKSVFSCQVVSVSRMPAVAPPQMKFSSGAVRKTLSGPENAATSSALRFAAGKLSAM